MQSRFPRDLQLHVSDISVSFQSFVLVSFYFLLGLFVFNLFSLDYGSAEEACDGSDKQVLIVTGKSPKPTCFKNIKKLPIKYHANSKAWMTTEIFCSFLHFLDAQMGAQNRQIILLVDNCAAHPKHTPFLRNVGTVPGKLYKYTPAT